MEHRSGSVCENFYRIFQAVAQENGKNLSHKVLGCPSKNLLKAPAN
nr:hypothetical protein [uncultured Campylobacter sp.]